MDLACSTYNAEPVGQSIGEARLFVHMSEICPNGHATAIGA